ncbi:putative membrane protein [Pseudomonas chlororaphis]|uniref:Putative membrane protein n=1 Tax=Pseudomonas chlororaphis TaxID=587753 RepID=A0A3G7TPH2_9PSED|nr:putative membrane protein [Pseudomonas chlororaphis]
MAELKKIITLAVGVNLIVGVTLATSAARVIGQYSAGKDDYADLLVALLAAPLGTQRVILILAVLTTLLGAAALWWFAKARSPLAASILEADQEAGS